MRSRSKRESSESGSRCCAHCAYPLAPSRIREKAIYCDKDCYADARREETLERRGVTCATCGILFVRRSKGGGHTYKFCSTECFHRSVHRKTERVRCPECDETFERSVRARARRFCSARCRYAQQGRENRTRQQGRALPRKTVEKISEALRGGTDPQNLLGGLRPELVKEHFVRRNPTRMRGSARLDLAHLGTLVAIECDGHTHKAKRQQRKDASRDAWLESLGWKVLRFWNEEILAETERVLREIDSCIRSRSKRTTTTSRGQRRS